MKRYFIIFFCFRNSDNSILKFDSVGAELNNRCFPNKQLIEENIRKGETLSDFSITGIQELSKNDYEDWTRYKE